MSSSSRTTPRSDSEIFLSPTHKTGVNLTLALRRYSGSSNISTGSASRKAGSVNTIPRGAN